jgi:hypothetical protein
VFLADLPLPVLDHIGALVGEVDCSRVFFFRSGAFRAERVIYSRNRDAQLGSDDQATLAAMYAGLDLSAKTYSGLDDTVLAAMSKVQLAGLGVSIRYQEMTLFFLAEDAQLVADALPKIEKAARKQTAYVASYADFDAFFNLVVRAKSKFQAFNSAIAFRMLIDLATKALDEMDAVEQDSADG